MDHPPTAPAADAARADLARELGIPLDDLRGLTLRELSERAWTRPQGPASTTQPVDLGELESLRKEILAYHLLGVERASFLRRLEGDAREAEQAGRYGEAITRWQLAFALRHATYRWDADRQTWTLRVPGLPDESALPMRGTSDAPLTMGEEAA